MRALLLLIACLTAPESFAKKSPRRGAASRSSSAYASSSKRKPKLSYTDWGSSDDDAIEENYFQEEDYRSMRSSRGNDDFDDDDYNFQKRPSQKRKVRSEQDQAMARSEGTFSGAGKGPLYDAYNQVHTLAQVSYFIFNQQFCCDMSRWSFD